MNVPHSGNAFSRKIIALKMANDWIRTMDLWVFGINRFARPLKHLIFPFKFAAENKERDILSAQTIQILLFPLQWINIEILGPCRIELNPIDIGIGCSLRFNMKAPPLAISVATAATATAVARAADAHLWSFQWGDILYKL